MLDNQGKMAMRLPIGLSAFALLTGFFVPSIASGHGGGLNAEGCHNNRKTGDYHCHRGGAAPARQGRFSGDGPAYFANCSAARAAGAAPVREGQPGYSRKLDRDGDGVGCE